MTIKEILKKYHKIEIELLLAHVLRKPKEFVFLHPEYILSSYHFNILSRLIRRRLVGEPVAYILGYKDFYGMRFKVNSHVLIPHPETESLVDGVILRLSATEAEESQKRNKKILRRLTPQDDAGKIRILDIGTGSGCIIISLASKFNQWKNCTNIQIPHWYASDISAVALKIAKQNAKKHHVKVKFIQSDLLKNINDNFDIIIANLPYLSHAWKNNRAAESAGLKFEPKRALFTKEKGLMIIRLLLEQIAQRKQKPKLVYPALFEKSQKSSIKKDGLIKSSPVDESPAKKCWIYLEFDPRQKLLLLKLIKKSLPGSKAKFYKDYNNLWRYVEIEMKV